MNGRLLLVLALAAGCAGKETSTSSSSSTTLPIRGTWKLLSSTYHYKDSVVRNDAPGTSMIKIIADTHFAFLQHDLLPKTDTTGKRVFGAGGGSYELKGDQYTEHLEYCTARAFEGNDFTFTVSIHGDTLIQAGVEKLKEYGIGEEDVPLIEKYIRVSTAAQ